MVQAHQELKAATSSVLKAQGLQQPAAFLHKVVQLHETLGVRFGVMLVGQTGTGKSSLLRALQVSSSTHLSHLHSACALQLVS